MTLETILQHSQHGMGVVTSVRDDESFEITFKESGTTRRFFTDSDQLSYEDGNPIFTPEPEVAPKSMKQVNTVKESIPWAAEDLQRMKEILSSDEYFRAQISTPPTEKDKIFDEFDGTSKITEASDDKYATSYDIIVSENAELRKILSKYGATLEPYYNHPTKRLVHGPRKHIHKIITDLMSGG